MPRSTGRSPSTVDIEAQTARIVIPEIIEATGRPIMSRHSEAEHRVRIDSPRRGSTSPLTGTLSGSVGTAAMELDLDDCFGQFSVLRHSGTGAVHRA
jgi:hypothetical protein